MYLFIRYATIYKSVQFIHAAITFLLMLVPSESVSGANLFCWDSVEDGCFPIMIFPVVMSLVVMAFVAYPMVYLNRGQRLETYDMIVPFVVSAVCFSASMVLLHIGSEQWTTPFFPSTWYWTALVLYLNCVVAFIEGMIALAYPGYYYTKLYSNYPGGGCPPMPKQAEPKLGKIS